jgi:hypothetical protein
MAVSAMFGAFKHASTAGTRASTSVVLKNALQTLHAQTRTQALSTGTRHLHSSYQTIPTTSTRNFSRAFSSTVWRLNVQHPAPEAPTPPRRRLPRIRTVVKFTGYLIGSTIVGIFVLTGGIFLHDALTYTERVCISCHLDSCLCLIIGCIEH